jgi:hypothetical protein
LPAARWTALAFSTASASACFFSNRFFFQVANVSGVTGVSGELYEDEEEAGDDDWDIARLLARYVSPHGKRHRGY